MTKFRVCKAIGWAFPPSLTGPSKHQASSISFSLSQKRTEINGKSCYSLSFLRAENYLWQKIRYLPRHLPILSPQSLSNADSLMVISVRISVQQNGKRSMTSSELHVPSLSQLRLWCSTQGLVGRGREGGREGKRPDGGYKKHLREWGMPER